MTGVEARVRPMMAGGAVRASAAHVSLAVLTLGVLSACMPGAIPPEIANIEALEARILALSEHCTEESCLRTIPLSYTNSIFDVESEDDRFQISYYCSLNIPNHAPILSSAAALETVAEECSAVDGQSALLFPHWWETTCFYNTDYQDSNYGTLNVPEYVGDFGDYLYVVCRTYYHELYM